MTFKKCVVATCGFDGWCDGYVWVPGMTEHTGVCVWYVEQQNGIDAKICKRSEGKLCCSIAFRNKKINMKIMYYGKIITTIDIHTDFSIFEI